MTAYIEPTMESAGNFLKRGIKGPLVMLNLLRFREVADYAAHPELKPGTPITGAQAYDLYMTHTLPYLRQSGGELLFVGDGGSLLIGPAGERWDRILLVQQSSIEAFMSFAANERYLAGLGHRIAAIEDSRLLPLVASEAFAGLGPIAPDL
jgi:uncharacterized protein (DUF1330 family)